MSWARWLGAWISAVMAGVGLAITVYIAIWLGVGALACDDGCEEPLGIALLATGAALVTLLIGTGLILRQTARWFREL